MIFCYTIAFRRLVLADYREIISFRQALFTQPELLSRSERIESGIQWLIAGLIATAVLWYSVRHFESDTE